MHRKFNTFIESQLDQIRSKDLYKAERNLISPQAGHIKVSTGEQGARNVINL
ncbi:MAG: hypothetical protein ACRBBN_03520 [Methyloligellaceae bacterium]